MKLRTLVVLLLTLVFTIFKVSPAKAHNTEPRIEISIERLHPGEVVDVRGVSFGMDDTVTLSLIGAGVDIPLAEMLANAEGEFAHIAVLPTDLLEGTYYFRAVTSHHFVLSPPLTVWGTALTEGGGQGPRDEDDGLLAPMPTYPPGFVPGGVVQPTPVAGPIPQQTAVSNLSPMLLLGLSILLVLAVFFVFRRSAVAKG